MSSTEGSRSNNGSNRLLSNQEICPDKCQNVLGQNAKLSYWRILRKFGVSVQSHKVDHLKLLFQWLPDMSLLLVLTCLENCDLKKVKFFLTVVAGHLCFMVIRDSDWRVQNNYLYCAFIRTSSATPQEHFSLHFLFVHVFLFPQHFWWDPSAVSGCLLELLRNQGSCPFGVFFFFLLA